jgi:lysophospholipid acyltransferase (LPLAT)-like uncharacterized protein
MNTKHFEIAKAQIHEIWHNELKMVAFFTKMQKIIKLYKGFCKQKVIDF